MPFSRNALIEPGAADLEVLPLTIDCPDKIFTKGHNSFDATGRFSIQTASLHRPAVSSVVPARFTLVNRQNIKTEFVNCG
jgi:hypothetical protein